MLVIDASCLFQVVTKRPNWQQITSLISTDSYAAPHIIDVEVLGVIRRELFAGRLDGTAASLAVQELRDWPGERHDHRPLLTRAWQLRANVRGWDAMYVALAEALGATLVTSDARIARAPGLRCAIQLIPRP